MARDTKIGWCDHTLNFWWGCNKVSEECRHCYIEPIMKRAGAAPFRGPVRLSGAWKQARGLNGAAKREGVRRRVFTCSMSDFFHPGADAWRTEAWALIHSCPDLDWLILTKRPERIKEALPEDWHDGYVNVWLGVTCGHPDSYARLDELLALPAALRFVSCEPLLAPLDLRPWLDTGKLGWVITGCERAARSERRTMETRWVATIDADCRAAGVAHYYKQAYDQDEQGEEVGVPNEEPLLGGVVVQEHPLPLGLARLRGGVGA